MQGATEKIAFAGLEVHFGLDSAETNNQMSMFKCVVHPGAKMGVPHYHEHFDEAVYGLKGIVTYTVNGKTIELGAGDSLFVPRGAVHAFINLHSDTAEFMCATTPAAIGAGYFREVAAVFNAGGPPDVAKLEKILADHGLVPVKP